MIGFILCAAFVTIFVSTSALPVGDLEKRQLNNSGSCYFKNHTYEHDQVFTIGSSKCLKYRCDNGVVNISEAGCDINGNCFAVGSLYEHRCRNYTCTMITIYGSNYYQTAVVSTRCQDSEGRCHDPGSEVSLVFRGELHRRCNCSIEDSSFVWYTCRSENLDQ